MGKWKWIAGVGVGIIGLKIAHNYRKINYLNIAKKITPHDEEVLKVAQKICLKYEDGYHIEQLLDIFDYMKTLKYIDDPNPYDTQLPRTTLISGEGDCDEFAVTTASLINAIGGTARVVTIFNNEIGHAFCEIYMGEEGNIQEKYLPFLKRYGTYPFGWELDHVNDEWLLFDTLLPMPGYINEDFMSVHNGTWTWLPDTKVRYFY